LKTQPEIVPSRIKTGKQTPETNDIGMSRRRDAPSMIDSVHGDLAAAAWKVNVDNGTEEENDSYDEYMPIQTTTNPITKDSMIQTMYSDETNEEYPSELMSLRGLQSLGVNSLDVQTDVSTVGVKKMKSDSSLLVLLPGRLQPPPNHNTTDDDPTMKHIPIGRIDGFHKFDGTSPNDNHLTLSIGGGGGGGGVGSFTNNATTTTTTSKVAASVSNKSMEEDVMNASTTTANSTPAIQFRGRTMPTTTTFVLLHVTCGNTTTIATTGTTTPHKKSTKHIQPKVICKGVYNNVIVFGKGELMQEDIRTTTTTAASTNTTRVSHDPIIEAPHQEDSHGIPSDGPPTAIAGEETRIHHTQSMIPEYHHGTTGSSSEDGKLPAIEKSATVDPKSPPPPPSPVAKRSNTRGAKSQLPSTLAPHPIHIKTEKEYSSSLSSQQKKQKKPIEIQSKRSNQHHASSVTNCSIAATVGTAHIETARSRSSKQRNQQQSRQYIQAIESSTAGMHAETVSSMTCPQTPQLKETKQVLPETPTASLSQQQSLVTKAAVSSCKSSSRKRRRSRNIDATNKSPGGNEKNPPVYTLDTDDDDEFAFLGG
jgi:hypothetical protein